MAELTEYEIEYSTRAKRDLDRLSPRDFERVDERIAALAQTPRPHGVKKLDAQTHRIRVGSWRVIYVIDDSEGIVQIDRVRRREKDTYR